jgi:hypothetical protein
MKDTKRNQKIFATIAGITVLVLIVVGVGLYIRHQNAVKDANVHIQPSFTGPPEGSSNNPTQTNGVTQP